MNLYQFYTVICSEFNLYLKSLCNDVTDLEYKIYTEKKQKGDIKPTTAC